MSYEIREVRAGDGTAVCGGLEAVGFGGWIETSGGARRFCSDMCLRHWVDTEDAKPGRSRWSRKGRKKMEVEGDEYEYEE